eukprot:4595870-Lingulodinium_polyedra.AAC.1
MHKTQSVTFSKKSMVPEPVTTTASKAMAPEGLPVCAARRVGACRIQGAKAPPNETPRRSPATASGPMTKRGRRSRGGSAAASAKVVGRRQ